MRLCQVPPPMVALAVGQAMSTYLGTPKEPMGGSSEERDKGESLVGLILIMTVM